LCNNDIFVLPSYYGEGVPRSIQEAMSCSMPIITTDSIGCKETVENGENGVLIPVRDVDALVDAMLYYINNIDSIRIQGRRSREISCKDYDVSVKSMVIVDHIVTYL